MATQSDLQADVLETSAVISNALIGKSKINLAKKILEFKFGRFNPRPLMDRHVIGLAKSFADHGVIGFKTDNLVNVLVPSASCIEPGSLTNDINVIDPPPLTLTASGRRKMNYLEFLSGQHRIAAVALLHKTYRDEIDKLQKQQIKFGKSSAKYHEFDQKIKAKEQLIEKTSWWGIMVYEESKLLFHIFFLK
jgi:uncharacterized protein YdcH (DUF465 family)